MRRILFWCSRFRPHIGGIPLLCAGVLAALRARGYELVVITQHDRPDLPAQDLLGDTPVYRLPFWQALERYDGAQMHALLRQVTAIKRDFRPDLVHVFHIGPEAFFELQTRAAAPCPLVCSAHSMYPDAIFTGETVVRHILRSAAGIAACSGATRRQILQALPDLAPHTSVIHSAVAAPTLPAGPAPPGAARLLCVGRLIEEKGFDLALAALAMVRAAQPDVALVIAGDGPARAALEAQARTLDLAGAVTFTGWVDPDAVPALMRAATIVLMPSRTEGLPLVSLQAAWMARPLIAAHVGGLPEVVLHGRTGLLVAPDTSAALAEAILQLLREPERAAAMGTAAQDHVARAFSWQHCIDAYEHMYTAVLEQR